MRGAGISDFVEFLFPARKAFCVWATGPKCGMMRTGGSGPRAFLPCLPCEKMPDRPDPVSKAAMEKRSGPNIADSFPLTAKNPKNSALRSSGTSRLNSERATAHQKPRRKSKGKSCAKAGEDFLSRKTKNLKKYVLTVQKVCCAVGLMLASGFLSACSDSAVEMEHIHGVGYTADGSRILFAAHSGLVAFSGGRWERVDAPAHDYMGFQAVDDGFYASGHPASGSGLKNPLGIVKSVDGGKTLIPLGLAGESDFHLMAVGYRTHAIYVVYERPNSAMSSMGLFHSTDDAKTWTKSGASGLSGEPIAVAAHPTEGGTVAVGTGSGLFVSKDFGGRFERRGSGRTVTALAYSADGLLYVAEVGPPRLVVLDGASEQEKEIPLPELRERDYIAWIAVRPTDGREIAVATYGMDVYVGDADGTRWTKIADRGKGQNR